MHKLLFKYIYTFSKKLTYYHINQTFKHDTNILTVIHMRIREVNVIAQ